MARCGPELILIFFATFTTLGVLFTYITALQKEDVYPSLPYISDTGSYPPESCIFSFVLCSGAIIAFVILWIRYRHVKAHYAESPAKVHFLNILSFIAGFISFVGLLIVGSFQNVNVGEIHFIGAFMIFLGGVAYSVLQTCISHRLRKTHPEHVGVCVFTFRIVFCTLLFLFVLSAVGTGIPATQYRSRQEHRVYWGPSDGGYVLHSLSACSEWLAAFSYVLFFLTFHPDFERIRVDLHIRLHHHHGDFGRNDRSAVTNENTALIH